MKRVFSIWNRLGKELSIPLRMKRSCQGRDAYIALLYFQFPWGWNKQDNLSITTSLHKTFNSLEDETWTPYTSGHIWDYSAFNSLEDETSVTKMVTQNQNQLSIPLRMKQGFTPPLPTRTPDPTFNSLEDETLDHAIWPLRILVLSIPLRMKHPIGSPCTRDWRQLSIPLRMKHMKKSNSKPNLLKDFQFPWGWNWSTFILSFIL